MTPCVSEPRSLSQASSLPRLVLEHRVVTLRRRALDPHLRFMRRALVFALALTALSACTTARFEPGPAESPASVQPGRFARLAQANARVDSARAAYRAGRYAEAGPLYADAAPALLAIDRVGTLYNCSY